MFLQGEAGQGWPLLGAQICRGYQEYFETFTKLHGCPPFPWDHEPDPRSNPRMNLNGEGGGQAIEDLECCAQILVFAL